MEYNKVDIGPQIAIADMLNGNGKNTAINTAIIERMQISRIVPLIPD